MAEGHTKKKKKIKHTLSWQCLFWQIWQPLKLPGDFMLCICFLFGPVCDDGLSDLLCFYLNTWTVCVSVCLICRDTCPAWNFEHYSHPVACTGNIVVFYLQLVCKTLLRCAHGKSLCCQGFVYMTSLEDRKSVIWYRSRVLKLQLKKRS